MKLRDVPEVAESATFLDGPGEAVAGLVTKVIPSGPTKDALSGTWLGHALHPALSDLPIGFWTSAWVLDVVGGKRSAAAARTLVALGIASALPAAAAGASDWADTSEGRERRVGLVHGVANSVAIACYCVSYVQRRRGRRARGVLWGWLGAGAATAGGLLGGHLVTALGVGVDNTIFDEGPTGWTPAGKAADLVDGRPVLVDAGGVGVVVCRDGQRLVALADRCSHRGGPLHEGSVDGDCIVCPWHASAFRLADGEVERGPAARPQPRYEARVVGETVEVRRAAAGR